MGAVVHMNLPDRPVEPPDRLQALLVQVMAGEESALSALYDATSGRVYGLALRILRDRQLAEDATIEVFTQVWRQSARYDVRRGSVVTWLLILARSRAIDLLRARVRLGHREQALDDTMSFADPRPDPFATSVERERSRTLRKAVDCLPVEQRRAIEVAFFGGLSHSEVAAALGQPLGTVKTRIRRALATLRQMLAAAEERPA
jgi:RNA polymerase sigma-70 factor (ECF subfamily)